MCRCFWRWGCMILRAASFRKVSEFRVQSSGLLVFFSLLLVLQIALWFQLRPLRPNLAVVPPLPTERMVKALSFGDTQLYFRLVAFRLQNAGDTFGRNTPLKNYNYADLERWFLLLDNLDARSQFVPSLAGYYFSQSQEAKRDVPYIIRYLEQHYDRDPQAKWWWLNHAIYLANYRLKDKDLALRLAYKLGTSPANVPLWARQMPAFIHEQRGEKEQAYAIIQNILKTQHDLSDDELRFMNIFLKDRLKMLQSGKD